MNTEEPSHVFKRFYKVDEGSIFTITLPVRFVKHEQSLQSEYSI